MIVGNPRFLLTSRLMAFRGSQRVCIYMYESITHCINIRTSGWIGNEHKVEKINESFVVTEGSGVFFANDKLLAFASDPHEEANPVSIGKEMFACQ